MRERLVSELTVEVTGVYQMDLAHVEPRPRLYDARARTTND